MNKKKNPRPLDKQDHARALAAVYRLLIEAGKRSRDAAGKTPETSPAEPDSRQK